MFSMKLSTYLSMYKYAAEYVSMFKEKISLFLDQKKNIFQFSETL